MAFCHLYYVWELVGHLLGKKMDSLVEFEPVIGVDLACDYIRAVQVERIGGEYFLRNIGIKAMPPDSIEEGRIIRPSAVAGALKELFRERQFNTKRVYTAVRGKNVISRIITLPSLPHERLKKLIESEVNRYVIFSDHDKVVYYHPLEEFDEHDRRKVSVLLVVAQKSLCRSYYDTFSEAGLQLEAIDLSSLCILRELRNSQPVFAHGSTVALVFDFSSVSMSIFNGDVMRFSRSINIGNFESVETLNGQLDKLIGEVLLSIHFYQTEYTRGDMIQKLLLSSGATEGSEIHKALQDATGELPVEVHYPFANIKLNVEDFPASVMEQVDSRFLAPVGLALRGQELEVLQFHVDLMPPEIEENKAVFKYIWVLIRYMLVVCVLVASAWFYLDWNEKQFKSSAAELMDKTKIIQNKHKSILLKKQALDMKHDPLPADAQITANFTPVFEEIKRIIPKTVQLTSMRIGEGGSIEFEGIAESNPSIFYFVKSLNNSKFFNEVELGPHEPVNVMGQKMVGFVIKCHFPNE